MPFDLTTDQENWHCPNAGRALWPGQASVIPAWSQQLCVLVAFEGTWTACLSWVSSEGGDGAVSSSCVLDTRVPPLWTPQLPLFLRREGAPEML